MNIIVPINNGRSIIPVYIPTTTHQTQSSSNETIETNQSAEINPVVGWSMVGGVIVLTILGLIYFERMMKDL